MVGNAVIVAIRVVFFTTFAKYFKNIFFISHLKGIGITVEHFFLIKIYIPRNYYFIIQWNLNAIKIG